MEDIEAFVVKLLKDAAALPEEGMRVGLLARRLASLGPDDAARAVDLLYKKGPKDSLARTAFSALLNPDGLKKALGIEKFRRIYIASIRLELCKVSRLFTDLPPRKKGLAGYESEEEAPMELITLGERRAMSRKPVKDVIDRLLSDPDPMVIGNILNNPRTTEKEVLKIASKRPNSAQIIKLVASHRVWSKRYGVVKAIALNPFSPPRVVVAILEVMLTQDLRLIAEDKTLHPQVTQGADDLIKEREKS